MHLDWVMHEAAASLPSLPLPAFVLVALAAAGLAFAAGILWTGWEWTLRRKGVA
jgi:hypothetical protein